MYDAIVIGKTRRIVLDTNIVVTALRSRRGASFALVSLIGTGRFETVLSVSLVLEYESAIKRSLNRELWSDEDIEKFVDYIISVSRRQRVFYLWRPTLSDPADDMVLEVAVAGQCDTIVTYNIRDFHDAERFGIRVLDAREFLLETGG